MNIEKIAVRSSALLLLAAGMSAAYGAWAGVAIRDTLAPYFAVAAFGPPLLLLCASLILPPLFTLGERLQQRFRK